MLYYLLLATSLSSCDMVLQVSHESAADILFHTLSSASASVYGAELLYMELVF